MAVGRRLDRFEFGSTGIARDESETENVPAFTLHQNYPNPANPQTIIPFDLNQEGRVRLDIFNIRGQLVRRLVEGHLPSGSHKILWDGKDTTGFEVPSGVYFYRINFLELTRNKRTASRKLLILR